MSSNTMLAVSCLFLAIMEFLVLKYVFIPAFKKTEQTPKAIKAQTVIKIVFNSFSYLLFAAGIAIYYFKPLGE